MGLTKKAHTPIVPSVPSGESAASRNGINPTRGGTPPEMLNLLFFIIRLVVPKASVDGAVKTINKGIAHLDKVLVDADHALLDAGKRIEKAVADQNTASEAADRAKRIKSRLEELVA
jgi:hypothetical protein